MTVSVGATHVDANYTGDTHSLTFTTNGNGGAASFNVGNAGSESDSSGSVTFTVSGQPESINIAASAAASGEGSGVVVELSGEGVGVIATMTVDQTGTHGSIQGGTFNPGNYAVSVSASGSGGSTIQGGFSYGVTITVSAGVSPATIQWKNPAGGSFDDSTNWNPQQVPTSIDTAVFNLSNLLGLIRVTAPNDSVANMLVDGMFLELNGFVQVLQSNNTGSGFIVKDGGQLLLDNTATLITADGAIGLGNPPESRVTVTGVGTHWTVGTLNPLGVGVSVPGRVIVDQAGLLNAQKEIDVGSSTTFGATGVLEVHNNALVTTPILNVGSGGGTSNVTIDSGGSLQVANSVNVGNSSGLSGAIIVSGISGDGIHQSTLTSSGGLAIAGDSATEVEVKDGGLLSSPSGTIQIGNNLTVGKLHVHGIVGSHNASCAASGLTIGSQVAASELVVEDGGVVSSGGAVTLGQNDGELANVTVDSSSLLNIANTLDVGFFGAGNLTISGGATVASFGGAVGVSPSLGNGSGEVTIGSLLPTSDSQWHVSNDCLVGSNAVGTITLEGTFIPFTSSVFGATLIVDGTLTVGPFGVVQGVGKLVTGHRVVNGGKISPGFSPGVIEIDGDYEQTADGVLEMEASGLNSGDFDVLHVTGNATLDGTLEVTFLNDYLPKTGDVLPFLQIDGTVTGDFPEITFPQLAPGFQFTADIVNGQYELTALNNAISASSLSKLIELSSQGQVKGTKTVVAMSFTISGSDATKVIIRGLGPSLRVDGSLSDPVLQLLDHTGAVMATNDNWKSSQQTDIEATGFAPANDFESAIVATLQPGTYSAVLSGKRKNTKGIGSVDVHDLNPELNSELAILSTLGSVGRGDAALIGDFTIGNGVLKEKVLLRALGVSLKDTTLELANANGSTIVINDNWQDMQKADIKATGLAPANENDSAIVANLDPGSYLAIVRGKKNKAGTARLEVYALP